jgi:hypothetical protein
MREQGSDRGLVGVGDRPPGGEPHDAPQPVRLLQMLEGFIGGAGTIPADTSMVRVIDHRPVEDRHEQFDMAVVVGQSPEPVPPASRIPRTDND